jgi:hypothetical protein
MTGKAGLGKTGQNSRGPNRANHNYLFNNGPAKFWFLRIATQNTRKREPDRHMNRHESS